MTTTASYVRNAVTLTLLLCCLWAPSDARQQPTNCQYEELPTSFNLPSYLDFNREFHIHGQFFVNLSRSGDHLITFRPKEQSIARFYVSPHEADSDLWLYEGLWNSSTHISSMNQSLSIDHEEAFYTTLKADTDYTLRINFFDAWLDMYEIGDCETVFFEVQIAPAQMVRDRSLPLTSRATDLPTLDVKFDDVWFFDSPWNGTTSYIKNSASSNFEAVTIVKSYTLNVPSTNGRTWRLEASLGAEFLYGGTFGLVVKDGTEPATADLSCVNAGKCTIGYRSQINEHTLKVNLISGKTYVLSIFDRVGQKMSHVSDKAVPVSLNIYPISVPQADNFATCSAPSLPAELPTPFEEPQDTFHYSEKALVDLNTPQHTIKLKVTKKSYFRIHTLAHRIDIDLRLQDATGEIANELGFGSREEAIALVLEPQTYDLRISFWGTYDPIPCETFTIEIALAPFDAYDTPATTHCPQDKLPATDLGSFYQATTYREGPFYFNLKDNFTPRNISVSTFVVSRDLHFRVELGANFVLFDLNVQILGPDGTISGEPRRNHEVISALLSPGTHYLVISTSHVGSKSPAHFPSCAEFELTIDIFMDRHPALTYPQFPHNLNAPGYFAGGVFVHFAEEFLLPLVSTGEWTVTKKTTFSVKKQSIFRIWAEAHDIDIDFTLKEEGTVVASTLAIGTEETIFFMVNPGKAYELSLHYYRFSAIGPVHARGYYTANMELEIAPVTEDPPSGPTVWPGWDWIGDFNPSTCTGAACNVYKTEMFSYDQSRELKEHRIHFRVKGTDAATFRTMIENDFLYGDLSIDVRDHTGTVVARGVGGYNRMEILPKTLTPLDGNYTLVITEPTNNDRPRHVKFRLTVAMIAASGTSQTHTCPAVFLPYSMNSPTYLSDLSGQQTHWNKKLLVPPSSAWRDYSLFRVTQKSLFSLVIPMHDVVDVDVVVKSGTWTAPTGPNLVLLTSYGEESVHVILEPGQYFLELRFYSQPGKAFPTTDCYYYPAQVSIVPTATLDSVQSLTRSCSTTRPPARLGSSSYSQKHQRDLTAPEFSHVMVVEATRPTFFEVDIYFNFPVAALSMALVGTSGPVVIHQSSVSGMSHQTLHRLLGPGNYSLSIHDSFQSFGRIGDYKCADYHVTWTFDAPASGSIPPLEEKCMSAAALPKDLGEDSKPYGGPQNPVDGSFRIWGEHFLLNTGPNYIKFDVKQVSYVRAFAQGEHTADDVDFLFYKNTTTSIPIATSMGIDTKESAVVKVQPGTHYLDVNVWQIGSLEECPLFHLELAMRTESVIRGELTCPYNLPQSHTPPTRIDLNTMNVDGVVHSDGLHQTFYFTKDDVAGNTEYGQFEWRTTLTTTKEAFIYTAVMFDFIANDFRISIYNSDNQLIEAGISSGMFSRDSYVNFESWLFAELPAGTYTLKIKENLYRGRFDFEQLCHKFEMMLYNFGDVDPQLSPMLEFVWPADGDIIEPNEELYVYMDFSKDLGTPNDRDQEDILNWLKNNDAMYLLESRTNQKIFPKTALLWHVDGLASLDLVYAATSIAPDHEYTLHTEISKFKTSQGQAYINPFGDPTFRSLASACNGHGDIQNGVCVCKEGYAGPTCDSCAYGYHAKDGACVKDEPVTCPNNCNNHGECINLQGTGVCMCHTGYAGVSCDKCMDGYKKEGDICVLKNDPDVDAQPIQCEDLILPDDLNTWGLLHPNNEVHIQGEFYIDVRRGKHDTFFALEEDSIMRVYVEPHMIDVDIWLFEIIGNTQKYIEGKIAINEEEVVFKELKGVAGAPKKYLLQFRYFDWESGTSTAAVDPCHSVNMELAIIPMNRAKEVADNMKQTCGSSAYPYKIPTTSDFGRGNLPVIENDKTIQLSNLFVKQVPGRSANFIGSATFQVKTNSYWEMVHFHATTSTQFSFGDVAMLLEEGVQSNHCTSGSTDKCVTSQPTYNGNTLHLSLSQGNYTLWFYEPAPQDKNISTCAIFDFEAKFEYANMMDDEINCYGTELPKSLNGPGYIVSDYMHIVDDYLVNDANIPFKVTKQSVFRAYGTSYVENLQFSVTRKNSYTPLKQTGNTRHPDLFVELSPGDYVLRIDASAVSLDYCPEMRLEMALKPKESLVRRSCGRFYPPSPVFRGELPFGFGSTEGSVYFGNTGQEQVMTPVVLNFTQSVFISATVVSDFLLSNLQLVVVPIGSGHGRSDAVWGKHNYNSHELANYFSAGAYELQLRSNVQSSAQTIGLDACGPFDFDLNIFTIGQLWNNPCNSSGLPLPHNFNGIQHLGSNNRFNQAGRYRPPPLTGHDTHEIHFNVSVPSYFRIKLEPHAVDVDVVLMSMDADGTVHHIADGGYTFNQEESIAWNLVPGTKYYVLLHFWLFDSMTLECPEFIMHTSITPKSEVALRPVCGSNPPPHPDNRQSYHYSSQDQVPMVVHQFQQSVRSTHTLSFEFAVDQDVGMYVETTYDFISSDLSILLDGPDGQFYGVDFGHGSRISESMLSKGTYKVTIYQPIAFLDGCSEYHFQLIFSPAMSDHGRTSVLKLPGNLNGAGDLKFSQDTHFSNLYSLFSKSDHETVTMQLAVDSIVRISADPHNVLAEEVYVKVGGSTGYLQSFLGQLPRGSQTITFDRAASSGDSQKPVDIGVEIAVYPFNLVRDRARQHPVDACGGERLREIALNLEGHYASNELLPLTTAHHDRVLEEKSFKLKNKSYVHISLRFDFVHTDLEIEIVEVKSGELFFGKNHKNSHEFRNVLAAGDYKFRIVQNENIGKIDGIHQCSKFHVRIYIGDANDAFQSADCASKDLLPWNLNNFAGQDPVINIYGSKFLMRGASQKMYVNVTTPSLLSIFTTRSFYEDVQFRVYKSHPDHRFYNVQSAFMTSSATGREAVFILDLLAQTGPTQYEIEMLYTIDEYSSEACPTFGLQLILAPTDHARQTTTCPAGNNSEGDLPTEAVVDNQAVSKFFDGTINSDFFTNHYDFGHEGFVWNTTLFVKKEATLSVQVGYDDLISHFEAVLFRRSPTEQQSAMTNREVIVPQLSSYNAMQTLTRTLYTGNYTLSLKAHSVDIHHLFDMDLACLPLLYNVQLVPPGAPHVLAVNPPAGRSLDPSKPFTIDLQFSGPIRIDNADVYRNANLLQSRVALTENHGTKRDDAIHPTEVTAKGETVYALRFDTGKLSSSKSYHLAIVGEVRDQSGNLYQMTSHNRYTTLDTGCSGHGHTSGGVCICEEGYSGSACNFCAYGYTEKAPKTNPPVCVKQVGQCRVDSCSCDPLVKTYCKPLGECRESNGNFTCVCPKHFAGDRCEKCAADRVDYAQGCRPVNGCGRCDYGHCSASTNYKCVCDSGYTGEHCDLQKSGLTSDEQAANGLRVGGIIFGVFVILATVAFFAYSKLGPNRGQRYLAVDADMESAAEMSLFDDEEEDNHRRFTDREPEEEEEPAPAPKRHEPQAEEKLFSLDD